MDDESEPARGAYFERKKPSRISELKEKAVSALSPLAKAVFEPKRGEPQRRAPKVPKQTYNTTSRNPFVGFADIGDPFEPKKGKKKARPFEDDILF